MKALSHRKQQKGAVLILVTVALFTLLGFTALALDGGYLILNKNRLQDAVDSAALSGAKTLSLTDKDDSAHDHARDAVEDTLRAILTGPGFERINVDLENLFSSVSVEFSNDPVPFVATNNSSARFIRVSMERVPVNQFFSQLLVDTWQVRASAVAGTTKDKPQQIIPLLMCAKDVNDAVDFGFNSTEVSPDGTLNNQGDVIVIKRSSKGDNPVGPGNFLGLDFKCYNNDPDVNCDGDPNGGGASLYSDALSGKLFYNSLIGVGDTVNTLPGNKVGPSDFGLNTRFNIYGGNMNNYKPTVEPSATTDSAYYPDCKLPSHLADNDNKTNGVVFDSSDFSSTIGDNSGSTVLSSDSPKYVGIQKYHDYFNGAKNNNDACMDQRRIVAVPIVDCNDALNKSPCSGECDFEVLDVTCIFLNQEVTGKGSDQYIVAEKLKSCANSGGGNEGVGDRIVLYKDSDSGDS